uniref:Uncharacterized protein n=1 Tax=Anguilla anguilla TaxID=7936 RepID=A0A0E9TD03_ANGAN
MNSVVRLAHLACGYFVCFCSGAILCLFSTCMVCCS